MNTAIHTKNDAAYDTVGRYDQNSINGFSDRLLDRMIELVEPATASHVLDAMAGDGNLSQKLFRFCERKRCAAPYVTVLEYSRVQAEFARMNLASFPAKVVWGDGISMASRETGERLPDNAFDRVMIKSASHELPLEKQLQLQESIFRVLKPGGWFVNLGFLFEDKNERDEMRSIARVKDTLAGMTDAVVNRHFLLKDELYERLSTAGFIDVHKAEQFEYAIRSDIVSEHYFTKLTKDPVAYDLEHQAAQVRARTMRRNGRIIFEKDCSIMLCPGEITIARKPTPRELLSRVYRHYPYDFLRHLEAHRQMLAEAARQVSLHAQVLDIGCGLGLLAERLLHKEVKYSGIDIAENFIQIAKERYDAAGMEFTVADIQNFNPPEGAYDVVTLLNVIYQTGIDAVGLLRKAFRTLKKGGRLVISGPTSKDSFTLAEPHLIAQLKRDGFYEGNEAIIKDIRAANEKLLTEQGNYWSVEGMVELLRTIGFSAINSVDTQIYYGHSYMVIAEK